MTSNAGDNAQRIAGASWVGSIGLLVLRACIGSIMIVHGWQKLENGPARFAGFLTELGLPLPTVLAWVVTILELAGGVLLVAGLASRIVAGLLALEMVGTAFYVKAYKFGAPLVAREGGGWELDLALLGGFAAVALLGAGAVSVDRLFSMRRRRSAWSAPLPAG